MYLYFNQYHTVAESVIIFLHFKYYLGEMPCVSDSKASACNAGDLGQSLDQEDLLEKEMATSSSILTWKSHEQRNLVVYSPWYHKESDTT